MGTHGAYLRVAGHFLAAHFDHELRLLPAIEQLGADAQFRAAVCVLRLSLAKRGIWALNASPYLGHVSGDARLVLVTMIEEIHVFLLSVIPGPLHPYRFDSFRVLIDF